MTVADLIRIIRARIAEGYMPDTRARLLEQRGTMETAALDVAGFIGATPEAAMAALVEVYRD